MNTNQDALRALAAGLQCGDPANPDRDREALEARLLPLVRCALRSGRGLPKLVDWVHGAARALAAPGPGPSADPDRAAPSVARLLCARLVQQLQAHPARPACETVVA
jgi:hypothetical protein